MSRLPLPMDRVAVTGGRSYNLKEKVWRVLDIVFETSPNAMLVVGDATGADSLALEWAKDRGKEYKVFYANWDPPYQKAGGPIRNKAMVDFGFDLLVAFPGGIGTANMMALTMKKGIPVKEIY